MGLHPARTVPTSRPCLSCYPAKYPLLDDVSRKARTATNVLTRDEARRIAVNIAKLSGVLDALLTNVVALTERAPFHFRF